MPRRWHEGSGRCTLYQFDGKALGVPAMFYRSVGVPKDCWHDDARYQVVLWPGAGGKCTWALVLEKENSVDEFSSFY